MVLKLFFIVYSIYFFIFIIVLLFIIWYISFIDKYNLIYNYGFMFKFKKI